MKGKIIVYLLIYQFSKETKSFCIIYTSQYNYLVACAYTYNTASYIESFSFKLLIHYKYCWVPTFAYFMTLSPSTTRLVSVRLVEAGNLDWHLVQKRRQSKFSASTSLAENSTRPGRYIYVNKLVPINYFWICHPLCRALFERGLFHWLIVFCG